MREWQPEQTGLARCASSRARSDVASPLSACSSSSGTSGGGGGGGVPSRFSRIHLPRTTGEVRVASDVTVRMLPCPSSPRRRSSSHSTRRKRGPYTPGMP